MSQYVEISDNNYSGQTAQVTFNALEGGTYDLGEQVVPFTFYGDSISPGFSVYGEYILYYIRFYKTCSITVLPVTTTTTIPITTTTTTIPITTTTTTQYEAFDAILIDEFYYLSVGDNEYLAF